MAAQHTGSTNRTYLPRWALLHAPVIARCRVDIDFRMQVMSAEAWERPLLAIEAQDWELARGGMQ